MNTKHLSPLAALPLLFAVAIAPSTFPVAMQRAAIAQTTPASFPLPASIPSGSALSVDGSESMAAANESLKRRFEERFPGTTVNLSKDGTPQALQDLAAGTVDLAAIGRPLTNAEKAQGMVEVPIEREKIAIIVGPNNPFNGSITIEQFAQIFRGEITNWSQIGGPDAPVRFIDRPETSDTRSAFRNYPVFQQAPFQPGPDTVTVNVDDTAAVVQELGNDGIGYAAVGQVRDLPNVKVVLMHQTPPTDPRYPFSQPRNFVYRGQPSPEVQAFLGFATSAPGQETVVQAGVNASPVPGAVGVVVPPSPGAAAPEAIASPSPGAAAPEAIASPSPGAAAPGAIAESPAPGGASEPQRERLVAPELSPLWLLAPLALFAGALALGKRKAAPAAVPVAERELAVAAVGDRAPAVAPTRTAAVATGVGAAAAAAVAVASQRGLKSQLVLIPRDHDDAYAYWDIPAEHRDDLLRQGGGDLKLRMYDVTSDAPTAPLPKQYQQFDVATTDHDRHVPVSANHDYVVELGYATADQRWLPLKRSNRAHIPDQPVTLPSSSPSLGTAGIATAAAAGIGAVAGASALTGRAKAGAAIDPSGNSHSTAVKSHLLMVPRDARDAYIYWEIPDERRAELRRQGGWDLKLRIYDVTGREIFIPLPQTFQQYDVTELDYDCHVPTLPDHTYIAEIGYLTQDDRWLMLDRSKPSKTPAA